MIDSTTRVFVFDQKEFEKAKKELLRLAEENGINLRDALETYATPEHPEINQYAQILDGLLAVQFTPTYIEKIRSLRNAFLKEWLAIWQIEEDGERKQKINQALLKLKKTLLATFKSNLNESEIRLHIEALRVNNDLWKVNGFFDWVLNAITLSSDKQKLGKTAMDSHRGVHLDGKKIKKRSTDSQEQVQYFRQKLREKNLDNTLIDFLASTLNQGDLLKAPYYNLDPFITFLRTQRPPANLRSGSWSVDLEIESSASVFITMRQAYSKSSIVYEEMHSFPSGYPTETAYEGIVKLRVNLQPGPGVTPAVNVEPVEGYTDIYDLKLKSEFFTHNSKNALAKLREGQRLLVNDQLAIKQHLAKFKADNGELALTSPSLIDIENESFLLLMLESRQQAECLLMANQELQKTFFKRSIDEVLQDLQLVADKYPLSQIVRNLLERYQQIYQSINNQDLQAIEKGLKDNEYTAVVQNCLLSVTEVGFIKKLVNISEINTRLNVAVLTSFACKNQGIANKLLQPTKWERFKFWCKKAFGLAGNDSALPYKRFASPHLTELLATYPDLWDRSNFRPRVGPRLRFFNFSPNFYKKLRGIDLRRLVEINGPRNATWYAAADRVFNDIELYNRTFPQPKRKSNADLLAQYYLNNTQVTLCDLATHCPQNLRKLHEQLTDAQLAIFYITKINQDYESQSPLGRSLFLINDLWSDKQRTANVEWSSQIPDDKKPIVKNAAIHELAKVNLEVDKVGFRAKESLPPVISLAEFYLLEPFIHGYHQKIENNDQDRESVFSSQAMQALQTAILNQNESFGLFLTPGAGNFTFSINQDCAQLNDNQPLFLTLFEKDATNADLNAAKEAFKKLIKSSPSLYCLLKTAVSNLPQENFEIIKIKEELFASEEPARETIESYQLAKKVFQNRDFLELLAKFPNLYRYVDRLAASARFKLHMRSEQDLLLFNTVWEITLNRKDNVTLLELTRLLPKERFYDWLEANPEKGDILINQLTTDEDFYREFIAGQSDNRFKDFLIDKALSRLNEGNVDVIVSLLLNCPELGLHYLKGLSQEGGLKQELFAKFMNLVSESDLTFVISRYPTILESIQNSELFQNYQGKIKTAFLNAEAMIPDNKKLTLILINPEIKGWIQEIWNQRNKTIEQEQLRKALKKTDAPNQIGEFLLKELQLGRMDNALFILQDFQLMSKFLSINTPMLSTLIMQIYDQLKDDAALFTHVLLKVLIMDSGLLKYLSSNAEDGNILKKLTVTGEVNLLATLFLTGKPDISNPEWNQALTRILNSDIDLFVRCLPHLKEQQKFGRWLFALPGRAILFRIMSVSQEKIDQSLIIEYITNGAYQGRDLVNWLHEQMTAPNEHQDEPNLRNLLSDHEEARKVFINKAKKCSDLIIDILLAELYNLGLDPLTPLAKSLLHAPFFDYIFETASQEALEKFFSFAIQKFQGQYTEILTNKIFKILSMALMKKPIFQRLVSSEKMMTDCLSCIFDSAVKEPYQYVLLKALQEEQSLHVIAELNNKTNLIEALCRHASGNYLIELFLATLTLAEKNVETKTMDEIIRALCNKKVFEQMFNENVNPNLQHKLFLYLFDYARSANGSEPRMKKIKNGLIQLKLQKQTRVQDRIVQVSSPNELIDLWLRDGIDLQQRANKKHSHLLVEESSSQEEETNVNSMTYIRRASETRYFTKIFDNDQALCDVLLYADEKKLLELFDREPEYLRRFLMLCQQPETAERGEIALLKQRLASSEKFAELMMTCLIDEQNLQLQLMDESLPIYLNYLSAIKNNPNLLFFENGELRTVYINYFFLNGSTEDIANLLSAVESVRGTPNKLIDYLFAKLMLKDNSSPREIRLAHKLIDDFRPSNNGQQLISLLFSTKHTFRNLEKLMLDSVNKTIGYKLEDYLLTYLETQPSEILELFKDDAKAFVDFFVIGAKQEKRFLLLLINKHPDSSLLQALYSQFVKRSENEMAGKGLGRVLNNFLFNDFTASEIATIYSYEQDRNLNVFSEFMFLHDYDVINLLKGLPSIGHNVFNEAIYHQLEIAVITKNLTMINAYLDNFNLSPRFAFENKAQCYSYYYFLYLKLCRSILTRQRGQNIQDFYKNYIKTADEIVMFDRDGNLLFKANNQHVPYQLAIHYYEALARGLLITNDQYTNNVQEMISYYQVFREQLINSVKFNVDGEPSLNLFSLNNALPSYYIYAVLFAYSIEASRNSGLSIDIGVQRAFVNSLTYRNNQFVFVGFDNATPPIQYLQSVQHALRAIDAVSGLSARDWTILIQLVKSNQINLSDCLENGLNLSDADFVISKIYLDENNYQMRFKDSNEVVPPGCKEFFTDIIKQQYPTAAAKGKDIPFAKILGAVHYPIPPRNPTRNADIPKPPYPFKNYKANEINDKQVTSSLLAWLTLRKDLAVEEIPEAEMSPLIPVT